MSARSKLAGALLAPAFLAARLDVSDELTRASGSFTGMRSSLRSTLTVVQASLCVVLLVGAGLFVRSLVVLRSTDLGLDADRLIVVDLELTTADPEPELVASVYQDAMRALAAAPVPAERALHQPGGVGAAVGVVGPITTSHVWNASSKSCFTSRRTFSALT